MSNNSKEVEGYSLLRLAVGDASSHKTTRRTPFTGSWPAFKRVILKQLVSKFEEQADDAGLAAPREGAGARFHGRRWSHLGSKRAAEQGHLETSLETQALASLLTLSRTLNWGRWASTSTTLSVTSSTGTLFLSFPSLCVAAVKPHVADGGQYLPTPRNLSTGRNIVLLHRTVLYVVKEKRDGTEGLPYADILDILIAAKDEETGFHLTDSLLAAHVLHHMPSLWSKKFKIPSE